MPGTSLGKIALNKLSRKEFIDEGLALNQIAPDHSKGTHLLRGRVGYLNSGDHGFTKQDLADLYSEYERYKSIDNPSGSLDDDMQEMFDMSLSPEQYKEYLEPTRQVLDRPMYITRETAFEDLLPENSAPTDPNTIVSSRVIDPENVDSYMHNAMISEGSNAPNEVMRLDPGSSIYHPMGHADLNEVLVPLTDIDATRSAGRAMNKWDYIDLVKQGKAPFIAGAAPLAGYESGESPNETTLNTIGPVPRNPIGGALTDILFGARDFLDNEGTMPQWLGGQGIGSFLMQQGPEYLDDISHGMRATEGSGLQTRLDSRAVDLMDIAGLVTAPMSLGRRAVTKTLDDIAIPQRDPFTGKTFDELDQAYKNTHGDKLPEMLRRQSN